MESPKQQALSPGYRLEEYEIRRELGSGGFGITYLAWDRNLEREVVIKENLPMFAFRDTASSTVHPRSSHGEDADLFRWSLESFVREARTLAKFDHPHIVRVLRVFDANGTAYFVMPYVEGSSLDKLIAKRKERGERFGQEEIERLLLPLLDALETLHRESIYHRDIKPANVLVTAAGRPVLIDFGAARQRISEKSLTVVESPGYTPFEQLESGGNVGPWSDLYGLAATFYKVIAFETPPKANDRVKRDPIRKLAADGELRKRYSAVLLRTLDRALAFDEAGRPQNAGEMREAISAGVTSRLTEEASTAAKTPRSAPKPPLVAPEPEVETIRPTVSSPPPTAREPARDAPRVERGGSGEGKEMVGRATVRKKKASEKTSAPLGWMIAVAAVLLGFAGLHLLVSEKGKVVEPGEESERGKFVVKAESKAKEELPETVPPQPAQPAALAAPKPAREPPRPEPKPEGSTMEGIRAGETRTLGSIEMVWCPAGEFLMGSPESEPYRDSNETQHRVTLTRGFWLARTECTQRQWEAVMGSNPSSFKGGDLPVEMVSWEDVQGWLSAMNRRHPLSEGWKWDLPTEAQWEYACRAGTTGPYAGDLDAMAWYSGNSGGKTHPVGTKRANAWGLYDMHGNVWEWCRDWYGAYPFGSVTDPQGASHASYRVNRGGSWRDGAQHCRSANRRRLYPDPRNYHLGFRVAVSSIQ